MNDQEYENDYDFSNEELGAIKPSDVKRYMEKRAYGVENPPDHVNPNLARSTSVEFWKKAISYYMPNKLMAWNALAQQGNPTRSIEVNEVIKKMKKKEVRKQGKNSKARRGLKQEEFLFLLELSKASEDPVEKYGYPGFFIVEYSLIARIDCTSQFLAENLTTSSDFDFVLRGRLSWSKNVNEERDAPNQILIGAMDQNYCTLLGLAVALEVAMDAVDEGGLSPYVFGFSDDVTVPGGANKTKVQISTFLREKIFAHERFLNAGGLCGSHSLRKYASTRARKSGASKDEKDTRGRWKKDKRTSDIYDDVDLPYPDAKVAGILCVGGPCKYVLKEGCGVTDNFILEHVVPNIRTRYSDAVALVLGKVLLWFVFTPEGTAYLPQTLCERVRTAYSDVATLPADENPVKKVPLVISGHEGELYMDELGNDGVPNNVGRRLANEREQVLALHSQVAGLRREISGLKETLAEERLQQRREFQMLQSSLRRISMQPVVRQQNDAPAAPNHAPALASTLSPNPRTLYILWDEYEQGIGGRKAARQFTRQERGKVKHKYTRRKAVWDTIAALVRAGLLAQVAIDRIYDVYGRATSVTRIINQLRADVRSGILHPSLQV
jgi:hypothetical protein